MNKQIYCGRGNHIPYADYMDLINLSFGFTTPETQFLGLLPKLYREERRPQDSNYVVTEDGVLTAAVGAYDHEIVVCGHRLPCRGIGNVAVHPDHRSKGYMKDAMNAALRDMVSDGIALSTLGGRRQRYQYFGYDKAGPLYTFSLTRDNIRHTYGDLTAPYEARFVTDPADPVIGQILDLNRQNPFCPIRSPEDYLDVANTWHARLMAVTDPQGEGRFVGYCILEGRNSLSEVQVTESAALMGLLRTVSATLDSRIVIRIPPHEQDYIAALTPVAEGFSLGCSMQYNVLSYRAVTEAFLALKMTYDPLPDGELTYLIHGYGGDERITISVKDGQATVTPADETAPVTRELTHFEATSLLFSPISPLRDSGSLQERLWFPLPLTMLHADEV